MDNIIPKRENLDLERMAAIAVLSQAAGEALPEIQANARGGLGRVSYKYGMHLPNWFNGDSPGLRREVEATLPVSLTFLDNVKGEGLNPNLEILERNGVKPYLVYRPYFRTEEGINPAIVEGYANGAVIRMRDDYLQLPLARQAYEEGRFIVKLFNETNIGGEGFPRGRAGFAEALRYWKQARAVVKAAFPKAKIISLCNTPGNDDVWFTGDTQNAMYWYHGPKAAKANPSPAEIRDAIQSCIFREMFELCDVIGIHVYANIRSTVEGDLATWYSRRHEQALKFLTPYTDAGKKVIINEWDLGYDEGQEYRAQAVVYGLEHIVGPNDAILFVNHWWNGDKNEGAFTWDKHRTREDGILLPVVHAVAAFRGGASTPNPDPEEPEEPNPPPTTPPTTTEPQFINFTDDVRRRITFTPATVAVGQRYWRLKSIEYLDEPAAGGTHHLYSMNPHDRRYNTRVSWGSTYADAPHEKPTSEPAANFAMFGEGFAVQLRSPDGLPSDSASGFGMYGSRHVSFKFVWEEATKGGVPVPPTTPTKTLEDVLFEEMVEEQLRITPTFKLPGTIIRYNDQLGDNRKGFDFATQELRVDYGGVTYAMLGAQHPTSEAKLIAYAKDGDWGNVKTVVRLKTEVLEIPYRNQLAKGQADYARGDCGPACLAMYFASRGVSISVNQLAKKADEIQNDGKPGFSGLTLQEMQTLAAFYGTRLVRRDGMTEMDVLMELASENPVLVAYNYEAMPPEHKYDKGGKVGGHYAIIKGRKVINGERYVVLADPYYPNNDGANRLVRWSDFDKAWLRATENGNPARCGLLFR